MQTISVIVRLKTPGGNRGKSWVRCAQKSEKMEGGPRFPASDHRRPGISGRVIHSNGGSPAGMKTVLIADDHPLLAEGIASLLRSEFRVLGSVLNGRDLVIQAERHRPDLITIDIGMPGLNGIEAATRLKTSCPQSRLVCVTQQNDIEYLLAAFRAGIGGFVSKQDILGELLDALRTVLRGDLYVTPSLRTAYSRLVQEHSGKLNASSSVLTPRQREVLQLIAEGKSTKEIASALNISAKTVEFHRGGIAEVLGLSSIADLTRYALQHGIAQHR